MPVTNYRDDRIVVDRAKVWRYLDLSKFVALLQSEALFFPRADRFRDPWEGLVSPRNNELRPRPEEQRPDQREQIEAMMAEMTQALRAFTFVSCWNRSEVESAGLWDLYSDGTYGVAITSTVGRLRAALDGPRNVFVGPVTYLDYAQDHVPENTGIAPYFHKRSSFAHEAEFRALFQDLPLREPDEEADEPPLMYIGHGGAWMILDPPNPLPGGPAGIALPIDVNGLVSGVHVHPSAPSWFVDVVRGLAAEYGLDVPVSASALYSSELK